MSRGTPRDPAGASGSRPHDADRREGAGSTGKVAPIRRAGIAASILIALAGCVGDAGSSTLPSSRLPAPTTSAELPSPTPSSSPSPEASTSDLPPALEGRVWTIQLADDPDGQVRFAAGTLDGSSLVALPPGAVPLVADRDGVIVVEWQGRGPTASSKISAVALADGGIRELTTVPEFIDLGLLLGKLVLVTRGIGEAGMAPPVLAIDRTTGAAEVILAPAPLAGLRSPRGVGRDLDLSPSRRIMAVDLCRLELDGDRCEVSLLSTADWSVVSSFDHPGFVRAVTDELLIASNDNWPGLIWGLDVADGRLRWTVEAEGFYRGYATRDGAYVVTRSSGAREPVELVRIDPSTGWGRVLASWPATKNLYLVPELSTEEIAVVSSDPFGPLLSDDTLVFATVDLASGALTERSVRVALER